MTAPMDRRRFLLASAVGLTTVGAASSSGSSAEGESSGTIGGPAMISGVVASIDAGSLVVRTSSGDVAATVQPSAQDPFLEVAGKANLEVLDEVAVLGRWEAGRFIGTEITPLFRGADVRFIPGARGEGRVGGVLYRLSSVRVRLERWRGVRQRPDQVIYSQVASGERIVVDGPDV